MKGWVYVITNDSMPGLVKVGFSTKDPAGRAEELNHTGSPLPYRVMYDALVNHPYQKEQAAHRELSQKREGKEWFRCPVENAIAVIIKVSGYDLLLETYCEADKSIAKNIVEQNESIRRWEDHLRNIENIEKYADDFLHREIKQARERHENILKTSFVNKPFWIFWLAGSAIVAIILIIFFPLTSDTAGFFYSAIGGAAAGGWLLQPYWESRKPQSYMDAITLRDQEIQSMIENHKVQIYKLLETEICLISRINAEAIVVEREHLANQIISRRTHLRTLNLSAPVYDKYADLFDQFPDAVIRIPKADNS